MAQLDSNLIVKIRKYGQKPVVLALLFVSVIVVFSLVYWIIPSSNFSTTINTLSDGLYFSVITITTLGYGDFYPVTTLSRCLVMGESLFGVVILGFFLNAVAHSQAVLDDQVYKRKLEDSAYKHDLNALERCHTLIMTELIPFKNYLAILSTPANKRGLYSENGQLVEPDYRFNVNFDFHILVDMYAPSMIMKDINKTSLECFFESYYSLREMLRTVLMNPCMLRWRELDDLIQKFLKDSKTLDTSEALIRISKFEKNRINDIKMIQEWPYEFKMHPSNAINYYVSFYNLIHVCHFFIETYEQLIAMYHEQQ